MVDPIPIVTELIETIGGFALDIIVYLIGLIIDFAEGDFIGRSFMMTFAFILAITTKLLVDKARGGRS